MKATNPPQHMPRPVPPTKSPLETGVPTGPGTAGRATDVADPHPDNEEHWRQERHPGGAHPPKKDIGPNDAMHDGTAPPRPHNAGSGPR